MTKTGTADRKQSRRTGTGTADGSRDGRQKVVPADGSRDGRQKAVPADGKQYTMTDYIKDENYIISYKKRIPADIP